MTKRTGKTAPARPRRQTKPAGSPKPSTFTEHPWLQVDRLMGKYPAHTENSGKWLIFVPLERVDAIWEDIRKATEEGKLGSAAKVATAAPNPNAKNPNTRVICVYTYDWTDEKDVKRVRDELRQLGITSKIPYKADFDTFSGNYAGSSGGRVSKYYE